MNAKQVHVYQSVGAGKAVTRFAALALACAVLFPPSANAGSATATATATISDGGSVGQTTTTTPTTTTTTTTVATTSGGSTPNTSTTNGGGAKSQSAAVEQSGVTTFRPLPSVGAAASAEGAGGEGADTGGDTTAATSGGPATGPAAQAAQGPRLPQGARPIANITGGLSSVAVTGSPNQAYGISLPGQTVIVQGSQTMNIEGFVHNAGATPAMDGAGRSSFNVGAKVAADGSTGAGGTETGSASATGSVPADFKGPVITTDPFMDVIISYN